MAVAEALGWTAIRPRKEQPGTVLVSNGIPASHFGIPPGESDERGLPHYDTDWSATGPLIERYGIALLPVRDDSDNVRLWSADHMPTGTAADGPTPLIAVCKLIIVLHAAGKLKSEA